MEEFIIILLILAFAILVGSTLGFGDSLIFIPIAAIFLDIHVAIVLMGFWSFILSISNSIKYRQYFDMSLIKKFLVPGILGVVIGAILLIIAPVHIVELSLGIFIIIFIITKLREINKKNAGEILNNHLLPESQLNNIPNLILYPGAFLYGFVGGLIGTPGPINVALLEKRGHERESFISNFSLIAIITSSFRLIIYVSYDLFPVDLIAFFLFGIVITYGVTKIGHWLTPKISIKKFKLMVLILLTIIGVRLVINSLIFLFQLNI
jgi:uncharacterized membrane protein YfcA